VSAQPPAESGPGPEHFTALELELDLGRLAPSEEQAAERFAQWRHRDPFPEIDPALLNSADLFDYVSVTGMIHPFEVDPRMVDKTMKPASCGIRIGGRCLHWTYDFVDGSSHRQLKKEEQMVGTDDVLILPPNSIVYATLAPKFRLPDYIAARFNLSIKYVYRGLLVGTGPLVDPGFDGKLQIPLHNLTSTPCEIATSDAVLWMEFTKLSGHESWSGAEDGRPRFGRYVPFPPRKRRPKLESYLDHANDGKPIVSSIPAAVEEASDEARKASSAAENAAASAGKAAEEAEAAKRGTRWIRLASLGAAVIGAITLLGFVIDTQTSVRSDADTALHRSNQLERELIKVRSELRHLGHEVNSPSDGKKK